MNYKKIDIKNCTCYYFVDIMRVRCINFSDILLDKKSDKNISIYDFWYKIFIGAEPLRIWFDKIYGFIKIFDGIRYLVLFGPERLNTIYDRINYLVSEKSGVTYSVNHDFIRIKIDSYNSLPTEKAWALHNFIVLIKSVVNKNKNDYFYNIFLEKGLYEDKSYKQYFRWMFVYYKCYISIELMFLKELMSIRQANHKSAIFVTAGIF